MEGRNCNDEFNYNGGCSLVTHHGQDVSYIDVSISVCDVSIRAKQEEEILSLKTIE
jgi:hypothetical protein